MSAKCSNNSMLIQFNLSKWRNEGLLNRFSWNTPMVEINSNQRTGLKMRFSEDGTFPERGGKNASSNEMPQAMRFKVSWNSVQWCNHPTPSGEKLKDDTPEIWYQVVDKEILKKSKIQQNIEEIRMIRRKFRVNSA